MLTSHYHLNLYGRAVAVGLWPSQYDCCYAFCRPCEFNENPEERFRGRAFSRAAFEAQYRPRRSTSYYLDWNGCVLTREQLATWRRSLTDYIEPSELELFEALGDQQALICMHTGHQRQDLVLWHELSHVAFKASADYQDLGVNLLVDTPEYQQFAQRLMDQGYALPDVQDEAVAYAVGPTRAFRCPTWPHQQHRLRGEILDNLSGPDDLFRLLTGA